MSTVDPARTHFGVASGYHPWLGPLSIRLAAFVDGFRLPDGAATTVGEDGAAVSGRRRQRINPARGLLTYAQSLILDESTVHLDPEAFDRVIELRAGHPTHGRA